MVSESRRRLNQRLRQNWIEQNDNRKLEESGRSSTSSSVDDSCSESDLTSLSWLIDLDMDFLSTSLDPSSRTGLDCQLPSANGPSEDGGCGDSKARFRKPTHTYSAMITMAINETVEKQITVAGIYNWIRNNFAYYRETSASWKNSVRHCLSTNRRFHRVPQTRDKFGKRFWRIVPELRLGASSAGATPGGAYVPRGTHVLPTRSPLTMTAPSDDCNISEAIRFIGRWETIESSTGESQGSDSTAGDSAYDSSADSLAPESPQPLPPSSIGGGSGLFSPHWSCDSRLNEILRDLSDLEPDRCPPSPGFESASSSSPFEEVSVSPDRLNHRLTNFDNDYFLTDLNALNSSAEDWSLADLTQFSSASKPISDFLPNSGVDDFSSYLLLDTDLGFRTTL